MKINIRHLALFIIDRTLDAFDIKLAEKAQIYSSGFKNFSLEFNYTHDKKLKDTLKNQFRAVKNELEIFLTEGKDTFGDVVNINSYLKQIKVLTQPLDKGIRNNHSFLGSHIHMFVNRIFTDNQRFEEFTLYYFLDSYYRSVMARNNKKNNLSV